MDGSIPQTTEVSSIHWNSAGNKLVTSCSDMMARVWNVDEDLNVEISRVKNFNVYLMQSKFCFENDSYVATGGFMSQIYVWDASTQDSSQVACFDHSQIDPNFKGLEIEWQNSQKVAVTGKTKYIYLWSVERQAEPVIRWEGHNDIVEQI